MRRPRATIEDVYRAYLLPKLPRVRLCEIPNTMDIPDFSVDEHATVYSVRDLASDKHAGFIALMQDEVSDAAPSAYIDNVLRTNQSAVDGTFLAAYVAISAYCQSEGFLLKSGLFLSEYSLKIWNILACAGIADLPPYFSREIHDGQSIYYGTAQMRNVDRLCLQVELHTEVGGDF